MSAALVLAPTFAVALAVAPPDSLAAGWKGAPVCEVLQEKGKLRALRCTFPPGAGHERHFHAPHFGYILEGVRVQETKAGASWQNEGVDWHEVVNVGTTTAVYLIIEPKDVRR